MLRNNKVMRKACRLFIIGVALLAGFEQSIFAGQSLVLTSGYHYYPRSPMPESSRDAVVASRVPDCMRGFLQPINTNDGSVWGLNRNRSERGNPYGRIDAFNRQTGFNRRRIALHSSVPEPLTVMCWCACSATPLNKVFTCELWNYDGTAYQHELRTDPVLP
jgi:hypothetical protein